MPKAGSTSTPLTTSRARVAGESSMPKNISIFIVGVVVGGLLMFGWNSAPQATVPGGEGGGSVTATVNTGSNTGSMGGTSASVTTSGTESFTVQSPQDAGMEVIITNIDVSIPTWMVVYELYMGKPVRALGATMFFPEQNGKSGVISLLRATMPGTQYFVGQSLDTGSRTFTPHVNQEVLDAHGVQVGVTFMTK